jgi:hypothetical protein
MHTMLVLAAMFGGHVGEGEMMQAAAKIHRVCFIEWKAVVDLTGPKVIITLLIFLIILFKVLL